MNYGIFIPIGALLGAISLCVTEYKSFSTEKIRIAIAILIAWGIGGPAIVLFITRSFITWWR